MKSQGEIVLYQPTELTRIEVRMQEDTVWLTQEQIAILFGTKRPAITKHLKNIYESGELDRESTSSILEHMGNDGKQRYTTTFYNLDVILSVGYRVNTVNATRFRQWANQVLKDYLLRGYAINQQLQNIRYQLNEQRQILEKHDERINFFVRTSLPPIEGLFYDGQIFDAYEFMVKLVKSAKQRIVLIDNYVDDSVLTLLDKRDAGVAAEVYTWKISQQLLLDINRHDAQYPAIPVHQLRKAHDRFLIIDDELYHVGASVKDLGTKWTAVMKMNDTAAEDILARLSSTIHS